MISFLIKNKTEFEKRNTFFFCADSVLLRVGICIQNTRYEFILCFDYSLKLQLLLSSMFMYRTLADRALLSLVRRKETMHRHEKRKKR